MTTQEIKQAGVQAVRDNYNCNGKYPCSERDYCIFCNGENSAFNCNGCAADDFYVGFLKAANWRINIVWHEVSECPDENEPTIIERENGKFSLHEKGYDGPWKYNVEQFNFKRWAYVKDLIPDKED